MTGFKMANWFRKQNKSTVEIILFELVTYYLASSKPLCTATTTLLKYELPKSKHE